LFHERTFAYDGDVHATPPPTVTDALHRAIDDVLEAELDGLGDGELCDALVEVYRAEARLAAARSRVLAAVDARDAHRHVGAQTAAAYATHACRLPAGQARHHLRVARALHHLPATAARLAEGDLTDAAAARICRHHGNERVREQLERDDDLLSTEATRLPFALFEKVLAYWAQHADPDGTDDDAEARRHRRRLHLSRLMDGSWAIDGLLDPVAGATLAAALRTIDDQLHATDRHEAKERLGRDPIPADLARTPAQRRADALLELATRAMAAPAGARRPAPLISILVGYETFAGRICELADGTVLAPGDVTALLDHAVIERVVYDAPGRITEISHQRCFTGALRRIIELRDRTCTHPYCDTTADRSDIDHRIPHAAGGPTTEANGRLRCPFHNHLRQRRPDSDEPPHPA
jgi:hypothetical protein